MFIRWTFVINDKPVAVEVRDENEDKRISAFIDAGEEMLLFVPGAGKDAYVNLALTGVILREVVNEDSKQEPVGTENAVAESV